MGRRRRRKEFRPPPRKLPKIYTCPSCGAQTLVVKIDKKNMYAILKCGTCGISWNTDMKPYEEKIDVYNRFVDVFMSGELT
jgi:transcription elongation factor Elf1